MDEVTRGKEFDSYQIEQIRLGFEDGLSMEQVKIYADSRFDCEQMEEIRKGIIGIHALTTEQVNMYVNPKFDVNQMKEIIKGFHHGLTMEQIQEYAEPKFDSEQMQEMREEAESHLSEITTHYKGELGEFDYNRSDFVLLKDKDGGDFLRYNEYVGNLTLNLPKGIVDTRGMFAKCDIPSGFKLGDFDTSEVKICSPCFISVICRMDLHLETNLIQVKLRI